MKYNPEIIEKRRISMYYHCERRLLERYGIRLNINIWLAFHEKFYTNNVEFKIDADSYNSIRNRGSYLVVFEMFNTKFFAIFNKECGVFSTFLSNKSGAFDSAIWKNCKLIQV